MDLDQQDKAMEEGFGAALALTEKAVRNTCRWSEFTYHRQSDRRVSPAVGEHAIEECARLRTVLRETIVALRGWDGDPDAIQVIVAKCARALAGVIRP